MQPWSIYSQNNTYQCVLAVSGTQTYTIYLYADGLIQWTTGDDGGGIGGLGGAPALVGYNAGDGMISYTLPGSQTDAIIGVASVSNVGVPGMLVFRLDQDDVVFPPCSEYFLGKLFCVYLAYSATSSLGAFYHSYDFT